MADQGGMEYSYLLHDRPPTHLSGVRRGKTDCLNSFIMHAYGVQRVPRPCSCMPIPAQKRTYEKGSISGLLPGQMAFRIRLLVRTEGYTSLEVPDFRYFIHLYNKTFRALVVNKLSS